MEALPESRLLRFVKQALHLARRAVARYSSKFSKRRYTLHVTLLPTNGVVGIDASGFDRSHTSKHYTKRTKLTIQQLKVTLIVDTKANAIIDLHVTTIRKHDSQTAPSLIKRNTAEVAILLGDKGYDDQKIRALAREENLRPLIKHREFSALHKAWNARLDADL